jgi:hypothetical protein
MTEQAAPAHTKAELHKEINELKHTNLAGWRALGDKLLAGTFDWETFKFFMDSCPRAAGDIRGKVRRKMVEEADRANPSRKEAHDAMVRTARAFAPVSDRRRDIPDWQYKDH